MSSRFVLADTSAWVSHLTGEGNSASAAIGELLRAHRVAVNEVIRLELLTGAKNEAQYAELNDALLGFYESLRLPPTFNCYRPQCDTCKAERAVKQALERSSPPRKS